MGPMALIEVLVPVAQQRRRSAVHLCRGGIGDLADATTVYENPATTTTGDEFPLQAYSAQMFGAQGHLVEQLQDLSVDEREELAVDGAREAQLLTVTFFQPQLDEQVVQTVVLVRTDTPSTTCATRRSKASTTRTSRRCCPTPYGCRERGRGRR